VRRCRSRYPRRGSRFRWRWRQRRRGFAWHVHRRYGDDGESTRVGGEVLLVLALELLDEVVDEPVVEVLTTQVGVTGGGLDLEDTLLNGQEGDIESSSTEIEDEDVPLTGGLLVETVGDGGSSGLVDDTEDVQATDGTSVLGGLTLGVVEVSGDGDDGVGDGTTEVRLGGLPHLGQDHGGDFLGGLKKS
jgi:hypothetical protein